MKKKLLAVILTAAMTATLLAGCGAGADQTDAPAPAQDGGGRRCGARTGQRGIGRSAGDHLDVLG